MEVSNAAPRNGRAAAATVGGRGIVKVILRKSLPYSYTLFAFLQTSEENRDVPG
jgi:hypothetical protein